MLLVAGVVCATKNRRRLGIFRGQTEAIVFLYDYHEINCPGVVETDDAPAVQGKLTVIYERLAEMKRKRLEIEIPNLVALFCALLFL